MSVIVSHGRSKTYYFLKLNMNVCLCLNIVNYILVNSGLRNNMVTNIWSDALFFIKSSTTTINKIQKYTEMLVFLLQSCAVS